MLMTSEIPKWRNGWHGWIFDYVEIKYRDIHQQNEIQIQPWPPYFQRQFHPDIVHEPDCDAFPTSSIHSRARRAKRCVSQCLNSFPLPMLIVPFMHSNSKISKIWKLHLEMLFMISKCGDFWRSTISNYRKVSRIRCTIYPQICPLKKEGVHLIHEFF